MFTLSVVLGSSILYKDFSAATPQRLLKFIFGCLSTFVGVYLITSKRYIHHIPKQRRSTPHLTPTIEAETSPLTIVGSITSPSGSSDGLGETPPHLIGTSFGYHFTSPRILERRTSRSTLPKSRRRQDDFASAIWSRWRNSDAGETLRPECMGRTQSELPHTTNGVNGEQFREEQDTQSEIVDERGRNRGYCVV
jgi:hypothetical protein